MPSNECPCGIPLSSGRCEYHSAECDNCGKFDVPLTDGHCQGCICLRCNRGALDCGGSMNEFGWCDECELRFQNNLPIE